MWQRNVPEIRLSHFPPHQTLDRLALATIAMITLNGHTYKLCLLDTNVVSEMVKRPDPIMRNFFETIKPNKYIPCFSIFTILELRERDDVYQRFLEAFSEIPCLILKSLDQLFHDELTAYQDHKKVSPILISSPGVLAPKNQKLADILILAFAMTDIRELADKWNSQKGSILEGILSLVKNYPPKSKKYTAREIRSFVEIAGFQQIAYRAYNFAQPIVNEGKSVMVDSFPSIKMMAFTVFYKFYTDERCPQESDPFDIIISSCLPYVDIVVTEKHQADALKKIKQQDKFIESLEVLKLKDLQSKAPNTAFSDTASPERQLEQL
jgi:hypothetical protein